MELESVGSNIRKYRLMKKMRQEDLAEKAGLSTNYVGALERGEKVPSLETLIDILNALDISADMVLCDVIGVSKRRVKENRKEKKEERSGDRGKGSALFQRRNGYKLEQKQKEQPEDSVICEGNICCVLPILGYNGANRH